MWPNKTLLTGRDVPDIRFHLFGLQIWQKAVNHRMSKLDNGYFIYLILTDEGTILAKL